MQAKRDENKEQANRAYEAMFNAAREWICTRSGEEVAASAGAFYDSEIHCLRFSTMGQEVQIRVPEYTCDPVLENWQMLVLMHYLKNADGTPLTGQLITIKNVRDGLIRGTKFERTANVEFIRILKGRSEEEILAACRSMGAEVIDGRGDLSVRIPFLPNCPFYINFWLADEDFDANAKMFFDSSVDHYLEIEDAVTVGEIVLKRLQDALQNV